MARLKLVSTKIPQEWVDRLERYTKSIESTQSAVIRDAIGQYLDKVDPVDSLVDPIDKTVDPLRSEIEDIKARLTALEGSTRLTTAYPVSVVKPSVRPTKTKEASIGALTTGELFVALERKSYARSLVTLRRALRGAIELGMLPGDLAAMGVRADFEVRRSSNPKDNSVRWLVLE